MKTFKVLVGLVVAYYHTTGFCILVQRCGDWRYTRKTYRTFRENFPTADPHRNFPEIEALNAAAKTLRELPEI